MDLKDSKKKSGRACFFLRKKNDCKVFKIATDYGEQLILTEDHPLYNGIKFKKAWELKEGDIIITHPFEGVEYETPNNNIILNENDIIKIVGNRWKLIRELKNKNLLPLRMDSEHLYKLSKLLGFITGDGWLGKYYSKKRKQNVYSMRIIGKKEDLEEIKQDINSLGYNVGFVGTKYYESEITQVSGKKQKIKGISSQLHINSQSLAILMKALGLPEGNKSKNPFRVPKWIKESNLLIKRLYLAGLFGAELTRPYQSKVEKYSFKTPKFSQNKIKSLEKDGEIFLLELANLLSEFNIKINSIGKQRYIINKSNEETIKLTLRISVKNENLINLWSKVGYEYCKERKEKSMVALAYLKLKQKNINKYKGLLRQAKHEIETENSSILSTAKKFEISNYTLKLYLTRQIDSIRIKPDFPTFEEFIKESWIKNTEFVKDKIESIEEIDYDGYVYDLTMDDENHNFIANSIISHNCGVRLLSTNLSINEFLKKRTQILDEIYKNVPSGVGSKGKIKVTKDLLMEVLTKGTKWAVSQGYGIKDDIEKTEEYGCMPKADPHTISDRALQRGMPQLGSLGAGNHFLEIQKVDTIFDEKIAEKFNINKNFVTIMIHCGSRGLGHQVASDYIKLMEDKYGFKDLPDRELINAPIQSELGQRYYAAMSSAVNYAFANRQLIMHWIRESFNKIFGDVKLDLVYDLTHNTSKFEKHKINSSIKEVCIHRKGAARSFGPGREELPEIYQNTGQPLIIPGSFGTASYILVGTKKAEEISFGSTCFSEDTKIITNKGILNIKDIYERFNLGEQFLVPSINENNIQIEWKPLINSMKRKSELIEISISQTNRSNQSILKATPDHKFITINNFKLNGEEINKIIENNKFLCLIDQLPNLITSQIKPELAYLVGSLVSDGSFYCNKRNGKIIFTQKRIPEKIEFINYVQHCFSTVFDIPLKEYREKTGGGIIRGRQIFGSGFDYVCSQKFPASTILNIYNNLPIWIMSLDTEATCNYLAGLVDGDGTWNKKRSILQIYTGDEKVVGASVLACLKLGILPYISKQRKTCFIIQISEKEDLILGYTKRVKGQIKKRKYGQKLFSAKQLFNNLDVKWPYKHKMMRNNLMSIEQIKKHLHKYPKFKEDLLKLIDSPIRMQRVKKLKNIDYSDVYNIEVADNHNYIVLTDMFIPILVKNCHGAGRVMSRNEALRRFRGEKVKSDLQKKDIEVKSGSWKGLAEEAPEVYKDIDEVVKVSHELGIGNLVTRVTPLACIKG